MIVAEHSSSLTVQFSCAKCEKLSEWDCRLFLPALLSPQEGQEDQGDQEGRGHLWVPIKNEHAHVMSRNIYCKHLLALK